MAVELLGATPEEVSLVCSLSIFSVFCEEGRSEEEEEGPGPDGRSRRSALPNVVLHFISRLFNCVSKEEENKVRRRG